MAGVERKLLTIADRQAALRAERAQVEAELEYLRHIDDDAQRDAVISESEFTRMEAGSTAADVKRFERRLRTIGRELERLEARRRTLLPKLD